MAGYVSDAVVRRLPAYYRHLRELEKEGVTQISSQGLGERMRLTASQIRQDINCFGGFGRQGYGYRVSELRAHIGEILGLDHAHNMIIIGAGNIGTAVARYDSFPRDAFFTLALFDAAPEKIGREIGGIKVRDVAELETFLQKEQVDIAVVAVPADKAQALVDRLYAAGLRAFWNFAPIDLKLPQDAVAVNVHLSESLQILAFRIEQSK